MTRLLLRFDMRQPDFVETARSARYAAALDMASWADERGFISVVLSEHHAEVDGYLPSPLILAAGLLARTSKLVVSVSALLAVLRDPIALAEDIAVLDNMAPGRLAVTLGLGYRDEEYAMFGVDRKTRGQTMDNNVRVMLMAWTGETFAHHGAAVRVTPTPASRPHPMIFIGGASRGAARRAARFGLPFLPDRNDPGLEDVYRAECQSFDIQPMIIMPPPRPSFVYVSEDPERSRAQLARHILHDAKEYARWQPSHDASVIIDRLESESDLAASQVYRILTLSRPSPLRVSLAP